MCDKIYPQRNAMKLDAKTVKALKAKEKDYKVYDGQGLFLLVAKTGGKRWRLKYRFDSKEKVLALGTYPDLSLADARKMAMEYRTVIAKGIDPSFERKNKKLEIKHKQQVAINTFEKIAKDYLIQRNELNEAYKTRLENAFENDVYPFLRGKPITDIMAKDIIDIVKRVEERGAIESAHRLFTQISRVFKYAVSNQVADRNPCNDMDKNMILRKNIKNNYPTITDPKEIGILLNAIDEYKGDYTTKMALKILPYVFVRPFNIRHAQWEEIDFKDRLWRIPAEKMKTKREHLIPLTDTTITILKEMYAFSSDAKYIFHSLRSKTSPMSDATLVNALRRMGYSKEEIVPHGFRAMFSTITHEKSPYSHEIIETQLAHSVGNAVSQAYNRAMYLDERKELMSWWSDYLDEVRGSYAK